MALRRPRTNLSGARVSTAGSLALTSIGSNSPTTATTGELPWWLRDLANLGIGLVGGQSIGQAAGSVLCTTYGICAPGETPSAPQPTDLTPPSSGCPPGKWKPPGTTVCVDFGAMLPGGDPFITGIGDSFGPAVMGAFGQPALTPAFVSQPTMRCPPGLVLGKDSLCYPKSSISVRDRKWRPRPKPPISAGDAKAIRRADRAKNRVKRLAMKSGFTCRKR